MMDSFGKHLGDAIATMLVLIVLLALTSGWFFYDWLTSTAPINHEQWAIDAGHAEWIVDQATGKTEFQWKECE